MKVMLVINDYGDDYRDDILLLYVTVAIIPAVFSQDVTSRPFALTWSTVTLIKVILKSTDNREF